jgi:hypothetical protein
LSSPERNPIGPVGPEGSDSHVLRGGTWNGSSNGVRCADRYVNFPVDGSFYFVPDLGFNGIGFRVVTP